VKKKKRISRLLEMVVLIQARPDWRPKKLAEHFGISETRIYQDIRELSAAGVPIYFARRGYHIAEGFHLSPAKLSPDEVLELLYPEHLFKENGAPTPSQTLLTAKLISCLPEAVRSGRALERGRVRVRSSTPKGPHFRRLHDAVTERRRIRIRYRSRASGKTVDREVDPYALIYRKHSWYLIGRCHLRREVRKFRLSRVLSVAFTPLRFAEPKDFSLEEYTRGWWDVFGGEPANVAVRFGRRVADLIRDQAPRAGQTIQELPGGDILYRVRVSGLDEISWWLLQYGPDAEVLEPKELRQRMRETVMRMARLYARAPALRRPAAAKVAEEPSPYASGDS